MRKRESISKPKRKAPTAPGQIDPALKAELERASADLVYSSESGRPFEFFTVRYQGRRASPDAGDFVAMIGANPADRAEERSLTDFFSRHTVTSDPYDSESQKIRPRYEALMRILSTRLRDVKVYRIGSAEVDCYITGLDGHGNLAGLHTVAVEI